MRAPESRLHAAALSAALCFAVAPAFAAPPQETGETSLQASLPASLEAHGAAARLFAVDARLRELEGRRVDIEAELAERENARVGEGNRARRLAQEILLSELHGRAMASSPRDLVQNATMRSGLRRVASRTLAAHGARAKAVTAARADLGALELEEAKLKAERLVAEVALRVEQEEERRRRETLRQIFEAEPGEHRVSGGHARVRVAEAGTDDDRDGEREQTFKARKGNLPLPVQRKCRLKSLRSEELGGPYLTITSAKPSNVRAVAAGTVAFADELAPYGKLVVLDHGDGYFTVYGDLSRIATGAGASLQDNAVVGSIEAETPMVFQIRSGARTLTPAGWFRPRKKRPTAEGVVP